MRDLSKAIWAPVCLSYGRELSPLPLKWLNLSAVAPNAATLPVVVFTRPHRTFSLVNTTRCVTFPARVRKGNFWRVALRKTNFGSFYKSLKLRDHLGTCASFNQAWRKFITKGEKWNTGSWGNFERFLYNIYTVIFIFYFWQYWRNILRYFNMSHIFLSIN